MDLTDISLLKGLQNLLKQSEDSDSCSEDERPPSTRAPAPSAASSAAPSAAPSTYQNPYQAFPQPPSYSMEDWTHDNSTDLTALDILPVPEYKIIYKQQVKTEDVYLQMGPKTPSTSSCEDLIIKVHLPNDKTESAAQMQLELEERQLTLRTKSYLLHLPLPQPINPDKGHAKWDIQAETFTITLRMQRELDFVNFWMGKEEITKVAFNVILFAKIVLVFYFIFSYFYTLTCVCLIRFCCCFFSSNFIITT